MEGDNRAFLLDYSFDICALQLYHNKLRAHLLACENDIYIKRKGTAGAPPVRPEHRENREAFYGLLVIGIGVAAAGCVISTWSMLPGAAAVLLGVCIAGAGLTAPRDDAKYNRKLDEQYNHALDRYEEALDFDRVQREKIPAIEGRAAACQAELYRVERLLDRAYGLDLIPPRHQTLYGAVYLYERLPLGEEDVQTVLGAYSFQEHRSALDSVIAQQTENLLRRRAEEPDQGLTPSNETERRMQEIHTAVTAFFTGVPEALP